jgi:hypothetical protein
MVDIDSRAGHLWSISTPAPDISWRTCDIAADAASPRGSGVAGTPKTHCEPPRVR